MKFSDIYESIGAIEEESKNKNKNKAGVVWKAPSSFERITNKYWVEEENLIELLFSSVREVPLLIYGWEGKLSTHPYCNKTMNNTTAAEEEGKNISSLWDVLATKISSVYFDSPAMDLYRERIKRSEGAQLFRVRWYGSSKPVGDELLFLELKTHHEKWINTKSIKERVSIRERDMTTFLSNNHKWTIEDAQSMVLAGNPDLSGKKLETSSALLLRMHKLVTKLDLRPVVRSTYSRLAFQSSERNDLRLTVDRNVTLTDERRPATMPRINSSSSSWCLSDDEMNNNNQDTPPQKVVPYAVFEVKLSNNRDTPDSIQNLINNGIVLNASKFSKFITGAAAFNHDRGLIKAFPYWADVPAFEPIFNTPNSGSPYFGSDDNNDSNKFIKPDLYKSIPDTSSRHRSCYSSLTRRGRKDNDNNNGLRKEKDKLFMPQKQVRVEPKSYFANERTFIQWISAALFLITIAVLILELGTKNNANNLAISFMLVLFGGIVICYGVFAYHRRLHLLTSGKPYGYIDRIGPLFLASATFIGICVILSYNYVMWRGLVDPSLSSLLLQSTSKQCYRHPLNVNPMYFQASDLFLDSDRDVLLIPAGSTIFAMDKSPGKLGEGRKTVANVAGSDFEAITYAPNGRVFALRENKYSDKDSSELIEFEWNNSVDNEFGEVLEVVQSWKIGKKGADGIAWIPSNTSNGQNQQDGEGYLYVATDDFNSAEDDSGDRGEVHVYKMPPRIGTGNNNSNDLQLIQSMNRKLINFGLQDSKIGTIQYFEGLLYVLHDNAKVVRAWDILSGEMKFEFDLPLMHGGLNKKLEGMFLERSTESSSSGDGGVINTWTGGLRAKHYPSDSSLILHLALDTPAQVWSIAVTQQYDNDDKKNGKISKIVLPSCASPSF